MKENSISYKTAKRETERLIVELEERAITHIAFTAECLKRVLKENEIYKKNSEIMSKENLSTAEQLKVEIKENFRLKNQLENNRKEYQETYKDVREELKELKKENEELLQEKINNQKIIVLAQNDMLNYQAGFEDGKNGRTSAVQSIIENQQYYIFQKQIEKYERHIEKQQKENEELKEYIATAPNLDEMTATKFRNIQQDAYIQGRAEEQQKAEQIIYENYIPKQTVKDKIEGIDERIKREENKKVVIYLHKQKRILQELLEGRE